MSKYNYFTKPVQVRFLDDSEEGWFGGIAYRGEIICGCCGGVFEIDDLNEHFGDREWLFPYADAESLESDWVDISESILGDDCELNIEEEDDEEDCYFKDGELLSDEEAKEIRDCLNFIEKTRTEIENLD